MKPQSKPTIVIFNPEEFKAMTAPQIIDYIRTNKNTAIVGEGLGVDRHIIKYNTSRDWMEYKNPYSNK